jgi:hypothetical protein
MRTVDGTQSVRQVFTNSGPDRTADKLWINAIRKGGTAGLTATLTQGSTTIFTVTTAPDSIPLNGKGTSISGDNGSDIINSEWIPFTIPQIVLRSGQTYNLTLTTSGGSSYRAAVIRDGAAGGYGFATSTVFSDGYAQYNSGSGWNNWDTWGTPRTPGDEDMEFYFQVH